MRSTLRNAARHVSRAARRPLGGGAGSSVVSSQWTYESAILRILRDNDPIGLERVVELVAEEALRHESARGAWTSDVGIWGPSMIRREVVSAMARMFGTTLILEGGDEGSWLVAPVAAR